MLNDTHSIRQRGIYLSSGYEYPGQVLSLGYRIGLPAARDRCLRTDASSSGH